MLFSNSKNIKHVSYIILDTSSLVLKYLYIWIFRQGNLNEMLHKINLTESHGSHFTWRPLLSEGNGWQRDESGRPIQISSNTGGTVTNQARIEPIGMKEAFTTLRKSSAVSSKDGEVSEWC